MVSGACDFLQESFPTPWRPRRMLRLMTMLAALRRHPDFAGFFDLVFPLFWPVLAWQLVRASKQFA